MVETGVSKVFMLMIVLEVTGDSMEVTEAVEAVYEHPASKVFNISEAEKDSTKPVSRVDLIMSPLSTLARLPLMESWLGFKPVKDWSKLHLRISKLGRVSDSIEPRRLLLGLEW